MRKGIVMEVEKRFVTVLTPEGEFLRARNDNPHYQLGQEITFIPVEKNRSSLFIFFRSKVLVPTVALMLACLFFIPLYQNNQVYAYFSIDINPSIELGVNKKFEVIELKSYNDDGKKIINQIQGWKHKDVDDVVEDLVGEIKRQGYMKDKQRMVVATVFAKEEHRKKDKQLKQEMKEIKELAAVEKLDLTILEGTPVEREKAITEGLTTGLYKEKKRKEHKAKNEAEEHANQVKEKTDSVHVEKKMNKSVETVPPVKEEKIKEGKEKNSGIPPGQIKKAEMKEKKSEKQTKKPVKETEHQAKKAEDQAKKAEKQDKKEENQAKKAEKLDKEEEKRVKKAGKQDKEEANRVKKAEKQDKKEEIQAEKEERHKGDSELPVDRKERDAVTVPSTENIQKNWKQSNNEANKPEENIEKGQKQDLKNGESAKPRNHQEHDEQKNKNRDFRNNGNYGHKEQREHDPDVKTEPRDNSNG